MKKIPLSIDDFKRLRDENYYFIDKSMLIRHVINEKFAFYTRPRRFGKTLNMSMLYYFFSNKEAENAYLFDDLKISEDEIAKKYQNQYPVIFLDLKAFTDKTYTSFLETFAFKISKIISENNELLNSPNLMDHEKAMLNRYLTVKDSSHHLLVSETELKNSLMNLTIYMHKHYGKKVIVLIDEYDVPLQNAYLNDTDNYYDNTVSFIKVLFENAMKTNNSLEKGILTGCLRVSKESIFTGLNNFITYSILDKGANDCFGFTENEVINLLNDYDLSDCFPMIKEWYDGYLFGGLEIYNPWSVLTYVNTAITEKSYTPDTPWGNSSGNDIVRKYIQNGDLQLHKEFESLMNNESLEKVINSQLTYRELNTHENIYSFLLLTGYLKPIEKTGQNTYKLAIPNKEVKEIYQNTFYALFTEYRDSRKNEFINALLEEDCDTAIDVLTDILDRSISYYDNKESFYHGFMIGLLQGYNITSNKESGDGRFDIQILPDNIFGTAIIIECKHSNTIINLKKDSEEGAHQIIEKRYMKDPNYSVYEKCLGFGISFYEKMCYIMETKKEECA